MFEATNGFAASLLSYAVRPYSSVVVCAITAFLLTVQAQDIFDAGLIHSVTDFAVFTELISGIDFAFFENRQIYHTLKDRQLPPGIIITSFSN